MKNFISSIFCALILIAILLSGQTAHADEPRNNFKFTCIPELRYLELTTVFTYSPLSEEVSKKYNFISPKDFSCDVGGQLVTIKLERMNKATVNPDGQTVKMNGYVPTFNIKVFGNDRLIANINSFGSYNNRIPHILTYDGLKFYVCKGDDERKCEMIPRISSK